MSVSEPDVDVNLRVICYDETVRKLDSYYGIGEYTFIPVSEVKCIFIVIC